MITREHQDLVEPSSSPPEVETRSASTQPPETSSSTREGFSPTLSDLVHSGVQQSLGSLMLEIIELQAQLRMQSAQLQTTTAEIVRLTALANKI